MSPKYLLQHKDYTYFGIKKIVVILYNIILDIY